MVSSRGPKVAADGSSRATGVAPALALDGGGAERAGRGWVFARVARRPEDADVGPNVPPSFEPGAAGTRSRAADAPGLYARLRR